jgi:very-short-patch-repair endonuclease
MQRVPPKIKQNARDLRKNMTDAERTLWSRIKSRRLQGFRFRRQHPVGNYIVDFVCLELKLVIELDGGQHMDQQQYDERRDSFLKAQGFTVLRFWNNKVMKEVDGVLESILTFLPPSQSSPYMGEEDASPSPLWGRVGVGVENS